MRNSRNGAIPSELGWLVDELDRLGDRVTRLEAPTDDALGSKMQRLTGAVASLTAAVADVQAALEDVVTGSEVEALVNARVAAILAGNVAVGGNLTVAGNLTANGATVTLPGVYGTDLSATGPRVVVWVKDDGTVGHT